MANQGIIKSQTYTGISSAQTSRYTIELWLFVEDASQYIKGINIIYVEHMNLTTVTDPTNNQNLLILCFPQEYC